MVTCTLCGLTTAHPVMDERGRAFCCPACQEVDRLLSGGAEEIIRSNGQTVKRSNVLASLHISLGGLWCPSCAWLIEETLRRTPGVQDAQVSFVQREAQITFDPQRTDPKRCVRRVQRLGYRAWPAGDKPYDEEDAFSQRLLISSVFVIHDVIISFMLYARELLGWASPEEAWLVTFFQAMMLLGDLPLLVLLGWPILRAGVAGLLRGRPNMHTLIAIGTFSAFALSVRNLLLGVDRVYFDTVSMLLFLVAVGRWLEMQAQKAGSRAVEKLWKQLPPEATWITAEGERRVPVDQVPKGARIRVRPGERFPVDGLVATGEGDVDESLLTGEPMPLARRPGDKVLAGTISLDGAFEVITMAVGAETVAGQIGRLLHQALWQRAPVERLADRLAALMVPTAVAIAIGTFVFWAERANPETALLNALSVLLIACPCALGLATPLTLWLALGRAAADGVLVRSTSALERLARVHHIFFDKTGTLTRRPFRLQALAVNGMSSRENPRRVREDAPSPTRHRTKCPSRRGVCDAMPSSQKHTRLVSQCDDDVADGASPTHDGASEDASKERFLARVAAVEALSEHPLAQAVVQAARQHHLILPSVADFRTWPGRGVSGRIDGTRLWVGSERLMKDGAGPGIAFPPDLLRLADDWRQQGLCVVYAVEERQRVSENHSDLLSGILGLGEEMRPEAVETVRNLQAMGLEVAVLTGDDAAAGERWQRLLGIPVYAEQLPQDKMTRIQEAPGPVAMVGDGINDGPALAAATVGLALSDGTDVARSAADIILLGDDLRTVPWIIALARETMRKVRQNLVWAFVYNLIGLVLAVTGHLQPVLAAAAMVASSLIVTGNALRLQTWKVSNVARHHARDSFV